MRIKRHIAPQAKKLAYLPKANISPTLRDEKDLSPIPATGPFPCSHSNGDPAQHGKEPARTPPKYPCPCCGYYTLPVPASDAIAYICPVCFWENDVFLTREDEPSDENHGMTLQEARANFQQCHACDPRFLQHVRAPAEDEMG